MTSKGFLVWFQSKHIPPEQQVPLVPCVSAWLIFHCNIHTEPNHKQTNEINLILKFHWLQKERKEKCMCSTYKIRSPVAFSWPGCSPHCYLYCYIIFCLSRDVKHYTDLIKIRANRKKGGNKVNIDETGLARIISVIQPKKLTIFSHFDSSCDILSVVSDHVEELKCKLCVIRTVLETRRLCPESLETGANSRCQKSGFLCCEARMELTATYHIGLVLFQNLSRDKSAAWSSACIWMTKWLPVPSHSLA